MEKLRWGVIGAGGIADRRTIPGLLLAKNAELTAVMEINREHAERLREKYRAKRAYDSAKALLADPEVDAVYIASPVRMHAEQAMLAADYQKHILIEKPVAMTADEGSAILSYCQKKKVRIAAGLMMRFGSHILQMKEAIARGQLGTVVSGYAQFTLWCPPEAGNWRQEKSKAGGGCMMDMGVHCIDLVEYITGMRILEVAAFDGNIVFEYDVEDTSSVLLRLQNGAQCVVQTNFNIPDEAAKWRLEFFGTKGRLLGDTVIGQNDGGRLNAVLLEHVGGYDARQDHADERGVDLPCAFGNLYTREIESFSDSILTETPLAVPASDAVHIQRVMEAAYRSNREKKLVTIENGAETNEI